MVIIDRERIIAAIQVDRLFKNFEIEMEPHEAIQFVEVAPLAGALSTAAAAGLIEDINSAIPPLDLGPKNPHSGKLPHSFRIGRERDRRIIRLELFKGYFEVDYDFWALFEQIRAHCLEAGAYNEIEPDASFYAVVIRWMEPEAAQ